MPVKKHLQEAKQKLAVVGGEHEPATARTQTETGFEYGQPQIADRPTVARLDALDHISAQLRPELDMYRFNARFAWCRRFDGTQHEFTRFYFRSGHGEGSQCVLLDIFAANTPTACKEVARKSEQIIAQNVGRVQRSLPPIGYLPVVRGAVIAPEDFAAVKRGEVLSLIAGHSPTAAFG